MAATPTWTRAMVCFVAMRLETRFGDRSGSPRSTHLAGSGDREFA